MNLINSHVLVVLLGLSPVALAQDDPDGLDQRQAAATLAINEVGKIERGFGYFETASKEYFFGPHGVKPTAEAWLADAYRWTQEMQALTDVLEVADENSLTTAIALVERTYEEKERALADLALRATQLEASARRGHAILAKVQSVAVVKQADFAPVASLLDATVETTNVALTKIQALISQRQLAMTRMLQESRPLIIERLKASLLRAGLSHLQSQLQGVADAMTYTGQVLPILRNLEQRELELGRNTVDLAYFQAQEAHEKGLEACGDASAKIDAVATTTYLKDQAQRRKVVICEAIDGHWRDLVALSESPARLVYLYAQTKQAAYAHLCRADRPPVNCERVAVLQAIPEATLKTMSVDRLRFYELAWSESNLSL